MAGELLSTTAAARAAGVRPDSFRSLMRKARLEGIDLRVDAGLWPDRRTPMYDAEQLRSWLAARPRGDGGRAPREADAVQEIAAVVAVVRDPESFDTEALRTALEQRGYRVGEVSAVTDRQEPGRARRGT